MASKPWTDHEDALLAQAIIEQGDAERINWHQVASHIPDRNNKGCRKRWVYGLAPLTNKGPWEEEEDRLLRYGVSIHGTKWACVARVVGFRNPDQCSRRWHEVSKPDINRGRWSLFEDDMLKKAVRAHGRRWIEIVERYFPDRTPVATRNRYNQLCRKKNATEPVMSDGQMQLDPWPASM